MFYWFMVTATYKGIVRDRGWMLASGANELIEWAKAMNYGIDIEFLGPADMTSPFPTLLMEKKPLSLHHS